MNTVKRYSFCIFCLLICTGIKAQVSQELLDKARQAGNKNHLLTDLQETSAGCETVSEGNEYSGKRDSWPGTSYQ